VSLTYATYLQLDALLRLQQPRSHPPEHDEQLFIVIHQTYELWFKLLLHEFEKVKADFSGGDLYAAIHTFQRCRTVMKTLVGQVDVLETMTPSSFASFRDRLEDASGFQSVQFRELEFLLGYKRAGALTHLQRVAGAAETLGRRLRERSVYDHFYDFLATRGVDVPRALRDKDPAEPNRADQAIQAGLLRLYREAPDCGILFELMTDYDEGQQEWRYRHVKMVERTIGNKQGTGGSPGVEFLKKTLFIPIFPDLWAIRHKL
jgi:tryptophan 2,3-dioxygenase